MSRDSHRTENVRDTCNAASVRELGVYGDSLNDLLFGHFNADVSKVVWLDEGRWLLTDCEGPGLYVIEMYPAKAVRDV